MSDRSTTTGGLGGLRGLFPLAPASFLTPGSSPAGATRDVTTLNLGVKVPQVPQVHLGTGGMSEFALLRNARRYPARNPAALASGHLAKGGAE